VLKARALNERPRPGCSRLHDLGSTPPDPAAHRGAEEPRRRNHAKRDRARNQHHQGTISSGRKNCSLFTLCTIAEVARIHATVRLEQRELRDPRFRTWTEPSRRTVGRPDLRSPLGDWNKGNAFHEQRPPMMKALYSRRDVTLDATQIYAIGKEGLPDVPRQATEEVRAD
jgi:hypothetical protein